MPNCPIKRIIKAIETLEGGGFRVRRPFPTQYFSEWDPFLLIDELGPVSWAPNEAIGAPAHPHRGFETISYILQGHTTHRDSLGHTGELHPGDIQWMTAGSGIVHEELPHPDFTQMGGTMHAFQIWLNLPPELKLSPPRYQHLSSGEIPVVTLPNGGGWVKPRVISNPRRPYPSGLKAEFLDIHLEANQNYPIQSILNPETLLYVYEGRPTSKAKSNLVTSCSSTQAQKPC